MILFGRRIDADGGGRVRRGRPIESMKPATGQGGKGIGSLSRPPRSSEPRLKLSDSMTNRTRVVERTSDLIKASEVARPAVWLLGANPDIEFNSAQGLQGNQRRGDWGGEVFVEERQILDGLLGGYSGQLRAM